MLYTYTAGSILAKPSLKDLSNLVAPNVDHKWYGLGVQLFDDKDLKVLTSIEVDYRGDVDACCTKMFERWLEIVPNASWGQLIDGLKAPNVKLYKLAGELLAKLGRSCVMSAFTLNTSYFLKLKWAIKEAYNPKLLHLI